MAVVIRTILTVLFAIDCIALVVVVLLFPPLSTLVAVPNPFESLSLELLVLLLGYESITFVGDALHPPKEQK